MKYIIFVGLIFSLFLAGCSNTKSNFEMVLPSPDSRINLYFNLNDGKPFYLVYHLDEIIVGWSQLGFSTGEIDFTRDLFKCKNSQIENQQVNENKTIPRFLKGRKYNQKIICLAVSSNPGLICRIEFRAYDEAVLFRYIISGLHDEADRFIELTELNLQSGETNWMISMDSLKIEMARMVSGDSIILPVTFENNGIERWRVSQFDMSGNQLAYLEKQPGEKSDFYFRPGGTRFKKREKEDIIQTPWRVIQFLSNGE